MAHLNWCCKTDLISFKVANGCRLPLLPSLEVSALSTGFPPLTAMQIKVSRSSDNIQGMVTRKFPVECRIVNIDPWHKKRLEDDCSWAAPYISGELSLRNVSLIGMESWIIDRQKSLTCEFKVSMQDFFINESRSSVVDNLWALDL